MGNGGGDRTEGAWSGRVFGTYLHGPVLARNTALADLLLGWALSTSDGPGARWTRWTTRRRRPCAPSGWAPSRDRRPAGSSGG